ncbi:MAG: hypothetical protein KDI38_21585 [Calditrichaeota bacterium]|nr:hypothetical protein [Calditrichota bacterium]MCB0306368.1 hypothetical protein [Calditrichota bacterium]MCB0315828.1 hypothetical protein [Calditrichota bacterium]
MKETFQESEIFKVITNDLLKDIMIMPWKVSVERRLLILIAIFCDPKLPQHQEVMSIPGSSISKDLEDIGSELLTLSKQLNLPFYAVYSFSEEKDQGTRAFVFGGISVSGDFALSLNKLESDKKGNAMIGEILKDLEFGKFSGYDEIVLMLSPPFRVFLGYKGAQAQEANNTSN